MIDIIFSINVHENMNFLIKQIKNINNYVELNYIIIINSSKYMFNEIFNCEFIKSKNNIILNKHYLDKKRFHGSLTKGIYLNMKYAIDNYEFKYFIILSSRNLFYNKLNNKNYNSLKKINKGQIHEQINIRDWHHWSSLLQTELSKYIIKNKLLFSKNHHEGLTFDYKSSKEIISFLNNNNDITTNLFNFNNCVEEFALQTICINLTGYYYQIGNWTEHSDDENIKNLPKNKYVYKTKRI